MFDKEEQKRRAAQFSADQAAQGKTAPVLEPIKVTAPPPAPVTPVPNSRGLIEGPFTNMYGQVINPGDKVVYVAQGYNHSVRTGLGTFVGYRVGRNGEPTSVTVETTRQVYEYNLNGRRVLYGTPGAGYSHFMTTRRSCLPSMRVFPTK